MLDSSAGFEVMLVHFISMCHGKIITQNLSGPNITSRKIKVFFCFCFFLLLVDGVKHTVLQQRRLFEGSQPAPSCTKIREAKESKAQKESSALPIKGIISLLELACGLKGREKA